VSWRLGASEHLPEALIVLGLVFVVADLARGRVRWYLVGWIVIMVGAFASWPFTNESLRGQLPFLFWQALLVPVGIWLAARPLVRFVRDRKTPQLEDYRPPTSGLGIPGGPSSSAPSGPAHV
jgi:hypothetical protein